MQRTNFTLLLSEDAGLKMNSVFFCRLNSVKTGWATRFLTAGTVGPRIDRCVWNAGQGNYDKCKAIW